MGYWTCWYESIKHVAKRHTVHAPRPRTTGLKHINNTIHAPRGLSAKIGSTAGKVTLKKVCVYTGTLGAGVGGIGGGLEKLMHPHTEVPTDPGILVPPNDGIPNGFDPGIDYGFNPWGIVPIGGGGYYGGSNIIPPYTGTVVTTGDTIPTIPVNKENVPEPSSYLIFGMAVIVFLIVRNITGKK